VPAQPRHVLETCHDPAGAQKTDVGITLSKDRLAFCHKLLRDEGAYGKSRDPDWPGVYRRLPRA
jgi:hypothetical protein